MYKRLLLIPALASLPLLGASDNATVKRIESLESELQQLKQQLKERSETDLENEEILDKVETKSILDKINFAPQLELRFDRLHYKNSYIEGEDTKILLPTDGPSGPPTGPQRRDEYTKNFDIATTVYFDLMMSAQLDEHTKFHGKLSFANTTQSHQRMCILSRDIKAQSSSSAFDVTLAYFDYTPLPHSDYSYTLSLGILPTSNGTPMQYAQNSQRSSMFPALVFDMNSYGVIYTQKLKSIYARAVFAQAYTLRNVFYPYQCNRENIDNATIAGIYFDNTFDIFGSNALLSAGFNALLDFKAHPYLGPDVTSADTQVLGNIYTTGIGIDLPKIAKTPLDLFAHTALSIPDGNGKEQDYKITHYQNGEGLTANDTPGFTEADYASGKMLAKNGYAFYTGMKYTLNDHFDIGAEYNHGSKYWFAATQGAKNMFNKLALRGDGYELYAHWMLNSHLFAKFGFLNMRERYTGSGWHFGEPARKKADQQIAYISLNARF